MGGCFLAAVTRLVLRRKPCADSAQAAAHAFYTVQAGLSVRKSVVDVRGWLLAVISVCKYIAARDEHSGARVPHRSRRLFWEVTFTVSFPLFSTTVPQPSPRSTLRPPAAS